MSAHSAASPAGSAEGPFGSRPPALAAQGTPDELCNEYGVASLDDVFTAATGHGIGEGGNLRDVRAGRRLSRRLG